MVFGSMLFKCMAMALSVRRLWLLTWAERSLFTLRFKYLMVRLTDWFIRLTVTCLLCGYVGVKYVPIILIGLFACPHMYFRQRIMALIGHSVEWRASWCMIWLRLLFFWFEMLSVIAVQSLYRYCCDAAGLRYVLVFHKAMLVWQNWVVGLFVICIFAHSD